MSISPVMRRSLGATWDGQAPASSPSGAIRNLWKFQRGVPASPKTVGDPAVERMGLGADDPAFLRQRKVDSVIGFAELLDLGRRSRLLLAEIVGRHAEHHEAAVAVVLPQRFETAVLRRIPAERRGVDDQHRPAPPGVERQLFAVDRNKFELVGIIGGGHRQPSVRQGFGLRGQHSASCAAGKPPHFALRRLGRSRRLSPVSARAARRCFWCFF